MARKSRKHPHSDSIIKPCHATVGDIRLSVRDHDSSGSIENQRPIIEEWRRQSRTPIMYYYIDNGFSGKRFDRPAFQQMIRDILDDKIECIAVKDSCGIIGPNQKDPEKLGVSCLVLSFSAEKRIIETTIVVQAGH